MLKLLPEQPSTLLPGHYVWFSHSFPTSHAGKYFRVRFVNPLNYTKAITLTAGQTYDYEITDESEGLMPTDVHTLYEMLVGINTVGVLTYLKCPAERYLNRLQESAFNPDPSVTDKRYIGHITAKDTPINNKRLRIHTVKDVTPVVLEAYNDGIQGMKIVYQFYVNVCKLDPIPELPPNMPCRYVFHPDDIRGEFAFARD